MVAGVCAPARPVLNEEEANTVVEHEDIAVAGETSIAPMPLGTSFSVFGNGRQLDP